MAKVAAIFGGLLILISRVSGDGHVYDETGPMGIFGGYGDYGSYRRYGGPMGYFKSGHNGGEQAPIYGNLRFGLEGLSHGYGDVRYGSGSFGHGMDGLRRGFENIGHGQGYEGLGFGNYRPGTTLHRIDTTHYPNTVGRVGGFYGNRGVIPIAPNFHESPIEFSRFGVGFNYGRYGSGINTGFNPHARYEGYGSLGTSPYYGYGFGMPYGYANGYGGYGDHLQNNDVLQSTELARSGYARNDGKYENERGGKGQISRRVGDGLSSEHLVENDAKDDTGYYANAGGVENNHENAKFVQAADRYDQSANRGEEDKNAAARRKGYVTKGFETSHHKDETGKTTTFYDEGNDEDNRVNYGGQHGAVSDSRANTYRDGSQGNGFQVGKHGEKGEYDREHVNGRENANKYAYGNRAHYGSKNEYGGNGDEGSHAVGGFSKFNKFHQQRPYFHH